MGIFNKTEEEIKLKERNTRLKYLVDTINDAAYNDKISAGAKDYLVEYVENIRRGNPNDFDDIDTLYEIIERIIDSNLYSEYDVKYQITRAVELYKRIVPKTEEDNSSIKARFIDTFIGSEGLISRHLFDESLYSIFADKNDYFEVMSIIKNSPTAMENFEIVKDYIKAVCKYCLNQDILKRDIIAFITGLDNVLDGDYEKYSREEQENAKRRIGVYNISPKSLAECDSKLRKMEDYLEQFNIFMTSLGEEKDAIATMVTNGKKEIKSEKDKSVAELRRMIDTQKKLLMDKLDAYLLELEELLKDKSDATFRQIIETYKNQVSEFRRMFRTYSKSASEDFLAIQKATEESVKKLEDYVSNEPQLQQILTRAQEQNQVREKIVELVTKERELLDKVPEVAQTQTDTKNQVVIPGFERVMVPYRHVILPDKVPKEIIPALDSSIPFDVRMRKVQDQMKARQDNGEIFHKKVEEIVIDLMEGDWPYLWGPSGTGKSFMAKQAASLIGLPFTKAGKITEPHSVLGYNDPQGRFRITPTFVAALYGYLLSLDEFDNGNTDTQVVLNDIYSELLNKLDNPDDLCEVTFGTDVPVDIHPNFRMIAAGNTSGSGENSVFSSRGKIDESIQERMTPIYIDYDDRVEERILNKYPTWYKFFIDFRNACVNYAEKNGIEAPQGITTTRDAAAIKKYIEHNSKSVDQVIAEKFVQTKDSEYRKALGKLIANMYGLEYSSVRDVNYTGSLEDVDAKVLAKKFVNACKKGVK